ncbi:MAG: peptidase domain-containing ABC transporter [Clostridium sp.]|nr:peptidase domain-containing ABC transporter [Clostridium sp.]
MPRIYPFQQIESTDCGITCIRILAKYYGKDVPLQTLRDVCDSNRLGISIKNLVAGMTDLGMLAKCVKIGISELREMPLPAILFWDQSHFVVLYKIKGDRFYFADPAIGKISLRIDDFMQKWAGNAEKGIAIAAAPKEEFYKKEYSSQKQSLSLTKMFLDTFARHKKRFCAVLMFTLLCLSTEIALPLLFQHTVDDGINGKDIGLVWLLIIGQFFVFIGNYVANNVVELILAKLGINISVSLLRNYLHKLAYLPVSFFDRKVCSDLVQKVEDHNRIKNFLVQFPQNLFITTLSLVVFSGLLIYESPVIFLIFIIFTAMSIGWALLFLNKRKSIDYSYAGYVAENRNNLHELIYGMSEVKVNNAQEMRISVWNKVQDKVNALSYRLLNVAIMQNSGAVFFSRIKEIAITGICASCVINGSMTIGAMMTVSYIIGRLSMPFSNIISSITSLQDTAISYSRIEEIEKHAVPERNCGRTHFALGDIIFDNVSFKYPGCDGYVLENVNAFIPLGKTTAIVGESGCGKSSFVKLLLKFYDSANGDINVGKLKLRSIDEEEWVSHCGAVMQNGYVFSGSIAENIAINSSNPDKDMVCRAAKAACLESFVDSLPMGFSTRIGPTGLELSGGQKQRLMIARAIYKNPDILILDEATSSLDANNEALILENIKSIWRGRTMIIIAHRLSTIKDADQILFMKDGRIEESGPHSSLVENKAGYFSLLQRQIG